MKQLIFLFLFIVIFYSCGKEEPVKIETFSTEAFAFNLGDSWEVNASTRIKGFSQKEEKQKFSATIAYDIDIITPAGDTIKSLISRVEDKTDHERIIDIPLEAQFNLDSTYIEGEYKVIFNIKDAASEQTATSTATFQLMK
ncbi:MAG: hypothetical protein A2V93_05595 [Ignavibacteria bacterium RBG_16_34_14]|nr:MAG: hypothetical protein A2V93_05595 [Ignavibacteria bacterium RBG_16_34_14]